MMTFNPALVIATGKLAEDIVLRTKDLICQRCGVESLPPIFQLLSVPTGGSRDEIGRAYARALSNRAIEETEALLGTTVELLRVETYIVAPLQRESYEAALEALSEINRCASHMSAGNRNALFLIPRRLLNLNREEFQEIAHRLDSDMQVKKEFPFNRCFFVDEVNESGRVIIDENDFIDLIANFIALSVASDLSEPLRNYPAPYVGEGEHHIAYASFCSQIIRFNRNDFIDRLSGYLTADIFGHLFSDIQANKDSVDWAEGVSWFETGLRESFASLIKKRPKNLGNGNKEQSAHAADAVNTAPERNAEDTNNRLDKLYGDALSQLENLADRICALCENNMKSYREFFEECLICALAALENFADELEKDKERISNLLIKVMLSKPAGEKIVRKRRAVRKRCLFGNKINIVNEDFTVALDWQEHLKEEKQNYLIRVEILNTYIALFNRLDLICACLDKLQETEHGSKEDPLTSMFELNLIDEEIARALYASQTDRDKNSQLDAFTSSDYFHRFKRSFFLYPEIQPFSVIREYCRQRFNFINDYSIEMIFRKRSSLIRKKAQHLSPFWRPLSSALGEKIRLVSVNRQLRGEIESFLDNRSNTANSIYFESQSPDVITVIQISYGLPIKYCVSASFEGGQ